MGKSKTGQNEYILCDKTLKASDKIRVIMQKLPLEDHVKEIEHLTSYSREL